MAIPSGGPLPSAGSTEIDRLRSAVAARFPVYETRVTPQSLVLLVHADPATIEAKFDDLRRELWPQNYIPVFRYERGEYLVEIVRRPPRRYYGGVTNLALLAGTVVTTVVAGAFFWLAYVGGTHLNATDFIDGGITFALPLLAILGLHELAHYLVARRHHVEASLPFFLPVPPPILIFGTFGAFISLREPIPDRKTLLDIGASGPIAGFVVAIPITILGMYLSAHAPVLSVANCGPTILGVSYGNILFGVSLFWVALSQFVPVSFVSLNPVALAGWVGLLVTAINLLPAGQLDGGHVFRALFGERSRYVSWAAVILLVVLFIYYPGWIIFAIFILLIGVRHPPPLNDVSPLDRKRWALGAVAAAILITGFVLVPISSPAGALSLPTPSSVPDHPPPGYAMAWNTTFSVTNLDPIPHGYLFATSITAVANSSGPLQGAAYAAFVANSTWIFYLPNGNVSMVHGAAAALPSSDFVQVAANGARESVVLAYLNTASAAVTYELSVAQLCNGSGGGTASQPVTI